MYKNYEDKLNTILSNAKGEKVELAIQDEVKRLYSRYINHNEKYDVIFAPIGRVEDDLRRWVRDMDKIQDEAESLYKKTDKTIEHEETNRISEKHHNYEDESENKVSYKEKENISLETDSNSKPLKASRMVFVKK